MCYNCGCNLPDDDMGKGHAGIDVNGGAITNKTFQAVSQAFGMEEQDAKKNTLELLQKEISKGA